MQTNAPRFRRLSGDDRRAELIAAGLACLARGGLAAFTVDNICTEAGASRGLITHHFGSKDALLTAVYSAMYDRTLARIAPGTDGPPDLPALIKTVTSSEVLEREALRAWLALWGEVAVNSDLRAAHRRNYGLYQDRVAAAITAHAGRRKLSVDANELAMMFISLVDGMWLEWAIDPDRLSADAALAMCQRLFEEQLGPLSP